MMIRNHSFLTKDVNLPNSVFIGSIAFMISHKANLIPNYYYADNQYFNLI
jgi:hypothetical protein